MDGFGIDVRTIGNIENLRDKYLAFKKIVKLIIGRFELQSLQSLKRLQLLESLERLKRLEGLNDIVINNNITQTSTSYSDVKIEPNSVIYCDIPYKGTATYSKDGFNYDKFYDWALNQKEPIFISEYSMPDDFVCIAEKERISTFSATNNLLKRIEKIFVPKHQLNI